MPAEEPSRRNQGQRGRGARGACTGGAVGAWGSGPVPLCLPLGDVRTGTLAPQEGHPAEEDVTPTGPGAT